MKRYPDEVTPPFLYLPDGRVVPVCVVQADLYEGEAQAVRPVSLISSGRGPGFPIVTTIPGR